MCPDNYTFESLVRCYDLFMYSLKGIIKKNMKQKNYKLIKLLKILSFTLGLEKSILDGISIQVVQGIKYARNLII